MFENREYGAENNIRFTMYNMKVSFLKLEVFICCCADVFFQTRQVSFLMTNRALTSYFNFVLKKIIIALANLTLNSDEVACSAGL
jgi:hypothetical protein